MSVRSIVFAALRAASAEETARAKYLAEIAKLTKALPRSAAKGRALLLPCVAAFYNVDVVEGAGKAEGQAVLDSSAKGYEAARKQLQRMVKAVYGGSTEVDVVARNASQFLGWAKAEQRRFLKLIAE